MEPSFFLKSTNYRYLGRAAALAGDIDNAPKETTMRQRHDWHDGWQDVTADGMNPNFEPIVHDFDNYDDPRS